MFRKTVLGPNKLSNLNDAYNYANIGQILWNKKTWAIEIMIDHETMWGLRELGGWGSVLSMEVYLINISIF